MVGSLLATQHGMAHAAQFGKHADRKGRVRANCPFCLERKHSADRGHSFVYYRGSGFYKCYRCGIKSRDDITEHEEYVPVDRGKFKWVGGPSEFIPLWGSYPEVLQGAVDYLDGRGIDNEIRSHAYIGACIQGRYINRVIIPHLNPDGTWWGWSARLWKKLIGVRSYDYPPDMARDKLYNEHVIDIETDRPVMVVEGVLDSLLYLPHAVACLGQPTREHLDILTRSKRPIALCLDADRWEVSKAWYLMLTLKGLRVGWVRLPSGTDPNEIDPGLLRFAADNCIGGEAQCLTK